LLLPVEIRLSEQLAQVVLSSARRIGGSPRNGASRKAVALSGKKGIEHYRWLPATL
jgi:hypothetical protein